MEGWEWGKGREGQRGTDRERERDVGTKEICFSSEHPAPSGEKVDSVSPQKPPPKILLGCKNFSKQTITVHHWDSRGWGGGLRSELSLSPMASRLVNSLRSFFRHCLVHRFPGGDLREEIWSFVNSLFFILRVCVLFSGMPRAHRSSWPGN